MYQRWFYGMVLLCASSIALSCIWLIAPKTLAAQYPTAVDKTGEYYQLIDIGGYVWVQQYHADALLESTQTDILVNLLFEQDALRIKQGECLADESSLSDALAALLYESGA